MKQAMFGWMANTNALKGAVEDFIRDTLRERFGQRFDKKFLTLLTYPRTARNGPPTDTNPVTFP